MPLTPKFRYDLPAIFRESFFWDLGPIRETTGWGPCLLLIPPCCGPAGVVVVDEEVAQGVDWVVV
jgi:hypothetical protein